MTSAGASARVSATSGLAAKAAVKTEPLMVSLSASVGVSIGSAPEYAGPYGVTPRVDPQTLATSGRLMSRDVDVDGIPEYMTSNDAGGYTCNIG